MSYGQDRAMQYARLMRSMEAPKYAPPPKPNEQSSAASERWRGIGGALPGLGAGIGAVSGGIAGGLLGTALAPGPGTAAGIAGGAAAGSALGGGIGGIGQMATEEFARNGAPSWAVGVLDPFGLGGGGQGSERDYEQKMINYQIEQERRMADQANKDRALQLALLMRSR